MLKIIFGLRAWILGLGIITVIFGTIYAAIQQDLRITGNDPQIQMAEDMATGLANGQTPAEVVADGKQVNLNDSLATFVMIYDQNGQQTFSSALLDGKAPGLPGGVLDGAKSKGETRVTWQPEKGVREAIVVKYYHGEQSGYVIVGRSLKEIEKREDQTLAVTGAGWLVSILAAMVLIYSNNRKNWS